MFVVVSIVINYLNILYLRNYNLKKKNEKKCNNFVIL